MAAGTEPPTLEERVAALEATIGRLMLADEDFMSAVRTDIFHARKGTEAVRLTHLPSGVIVEADTRDEAVLRLKKAVAGHARRESLPILEQP